jgi:hypothetical protein
MFAERLDKGGTQQPGLPAAVGLSSWTWRAKSRPH